MHNVYIDDLLIASSSPEEHLEHLWLVFQLLDEHGVVFNVSKSHFCVCKLDFLGHQVDATGIRPLKKKVQVIREFPLPDKPCRFLGLVNFYHRSIPGGAAILQPLHSLLKHTKHPSDLLQWTDNTMAAFNKVVNAMLLVYPIPNAPTSVMTDASNMALQQFINGQWCPLSFFS